jgi:hypothetical protein
MVLACRARSMNALRCGGMTEISTATLFTLQNRGSPFGTSKGNVDVGCCGSKSTRFEEITSDEGKLFWNFAAANWSVIDENGLDKSVNPYFMRYFLLA